MSNTSSIFETTTDDIEDVISSDYNKNINWTVAADIMDLLNLDTIQQSADKGDTIDEQTSLAMREISNQIKQSESAQDILARA